MLVLATHTDSGAASPSQDSRSRFSPVTPLRANSSAKVAAMALAAFLDLLLVVTGFLESVWAAGLAEAVEVDPPVEPRL